MDPSIVRTVEATDGEDRLVGGHQAVRGEREPGAIGSGVVRPPFRWIDQGRGVDVWPDLDRPGQVTTQREEHREGTHGGEAVLVGHHLTQRALRLRKQVREPRRHVDAGHPAPPRFVLESLPQHRMA